MTESPDFMEGRKKYTSMCLRSWAYFFCCRSTEASRDRTDWILRERAGQLPLGQSVAVAAACIMAGALRGDQQQVQLLSFKLLSLLKCEACNGHMVSVECHLLFVVSLIKSVLLYIVWPKCERTFYAHGQWGHRRREQ
jgi:hypothetical protein